MLSPAQAQKTLSHLNAFINIPHVLASSTTKGALSDLTVAIKDNICTADLPTTCGSEGLQNYTSPYDATVVARIRRAGGLIVGKTNMDEFGMGSHSTHTAYGQVHNKIPHLSAGGSSGGSAVAVATGQCDAYTSALGTDTGGSVRLPAAYNGIYGFKPSYGLLSRWGVVTYANSLDTVGILSANVSTLHKILQELNHHDPQDPTSTPPSTRKRLVTQLFAHSHSTSIKPFLRIGIPRDYNTTALSASVHHAWRRSLLHLRSLGHTLHAVDLPTTRQALSAYYVLAPAEASSNLAKYDGVRYGLSTSSTSPASRAQSTALTPDAPTTPSQQSQLFTTTRHSTFHPEVRRRILLGTYTLSAAALDNYFLQAQRVRRLIQHDFNNLFALPNILSSTSPQTHPKEPTTDTQKIDMLITPTTPTLPPPLDTLSAQDPVTTYSTDVFTVPASLAGLPAISVPVGIPAELAAVEGAEGMESAGVQVVGQWGDDGRVLEVAGVLGEGVGVGSRGV